MPHMMFRDGVPGMLNWGSGRAVEMTTSPQKATQATMPKERALDSFIVMALGRLWSSVFET